MDMDPVSTNHNGSVEQRATRPYDAPVAASFPEAINYAPDIEQANEKVRVSESNVDDQLESDQKHADEAADGRHRDLREQ